MFNFNHAPAKGGSIPKPNANGSGSTPPTPPNLHSKGTSHKMEQSKPNKKHSLNEDHGTSGAVASAKSASKKKKLAKSDMTSKLPTISSGKQRITYINILMTMVTDFFLVLLTKPDGSIGYMNPFVKIIKTEPERALDEFHIIGLFERLDRTDPEMNLAMPQEPGSIYSQKVVAFFTETDQTVQAFAKWLAAQLTLWANTSDEWFGTNNIFIYRQNLQGEFLQPRPVNYYIRVRDTLLLLRKVYGGKTIEKTDIEQDEEILTQYFGTVEKGRNILGQLDELQWKQLTT